MISSSSAIALAPAHPEAAQNEAAAVDECHPEFEGVAQEKIADQGQQRDTETDRDERLPHPQSDDGVDHHEIDRPERSHLARREMSEPIREYTEQDEQQGGREHPE